jgi:hypothetical protein
MPRAPASAPPPSTAPRPAVAPVTAPPPTSRLARPGPDLSKLPAAIRESLAKLAGDPAEESAKAAAPASDTTTRGR